MKSLICVGALTLVATGGLGQTPDPIGGEFQVNSYTTDYQQAASVAALPNGGFVVVWESYGSAGTDPDWSIQGKLYDASGTSVEGQFQVNSYTSNSQYFPAVASDESGNFIVVWTSFGSWGTDSGGCIPSCFPSIQGQRFSANGTKLGQQFQVNTFTPYWQFAPDVATNSDGNFVVVWNNFHPCCSAYSSIRGQVHSPFGQKIGGEFEVSDSPDPWALSTDVAMDPNGNSIVVWASTSSSQDDNSGSSIQARLVSSAGIPTEGRFQVNSYTTGDQEWPVVSSSEDGKFVVAWTSDGSPDTDQSESSIQAQTLNSEGNPIGEEFQVNTHTTSQQVNADISIDADGDFVVVWQSLAGTGSDNSGYSIQGQVLNSQGDRVGSEFQGNSYTPGDQIGPSVAISGDGKFVVAWETGDYYSDGPDGDKSGVQGQRFESPLFASPPGDRDFIGAMNPNLPTIILTHGLQPKGSSCIPSCGDGEICRFGQCMELWTGTGDAQAVNLIADSLGPDLSQVNIVQFLWEEAFQDYDCLVNLSIPTGPAYKAARTGVDDAGARLAQLLFMELGADYDEQIHFIGHSLGTAVNAHAAAAFLAATQVPKAQVTALDRPDNISDLCDMGNDEEDAWNFNENFFPNVLRVPRANLTILVDNYYSRDGAGVGDKTRGPAFPEPGYAPLWFYNHPELDEPNDLNDGVFPDEGFLGFGNNHSGVHQWYRWTIFKKDDVPQNPVTGGEPVCDGEEFINRPFGVDKSLSPCQRGWWWSLDGCGPSTPCGPFPPLNARPMEASDQNPVEHAEPPEELGCTIECLIDDVPTFCVGSPDAVTRILCSDLNPQLALGQSPYQFEDLGNPLTAVLQIDIPADATNLWFDYKFKNSGDGDYAAVFLGRRHLWTVRGQSVLDEDILLSSGPIPIGGISGTHEITVQLYRVGNPDAILELWDPRLSFERTSSVFSDGFESGGVDAWSSSTGVATCAHDLCETGDPLEPTCDPCVAQICAVDPFCCDTAWDALCVSLVEPVCGGSCP